MIKVLLQTSGWLIAHLPEPLLAAFSRFAGPRLIGIMPRRRRLLHSNLHHAFPARSSAWRTKMAHEVGTRLIETALLSLASPFFSEQRIRSCVTGFEENEKILSRSHPTPFPLVVATLHMTYWESLTWTKLFASPFFEEIGVIFRPLNNKSADAWVAETRGRFGLKLLSRKAGLQEAFKLLRRNGTAGLLFDQNAGNHGALTTLFGRVCSTTELVGALSEKYRARLIVFFPVRTGFWKLQITSVALPHDGTSTGVTLALNRWFENELSHDDNICASWLWSHDRWRNQDFPDRRFRLEAKRNLLDLEMAERNWSTLPRKTRFWIRLPNWLGDVVMALPLLHALRLSRPDAEITVIAKGAFAPFLLATGIVDRVQPLPQKGWGYFRHFRKLRHEYPDVYVLFTHSFRGDLEAWLTRTPQRFGVLRPGKSRPLLTHFYRVSSQIVEKTGHQLQTWETFFRRFGLSGELDFSPLSIPLTQANTSFVKDDTRTPVGPVFGLIAGSENTPEKRWPIQHWQTLIRALSAEFPRAQFILLGTANDRAITTQISGDLAASITDLAGKTDLLAFAHQLRQCSVLISNDTGGLHLANALGVPVIALFGPTNPIRTKPIFAATVEILQPPGCPPTGGGNLRDLLPETVLQVLRRILPRELARI